VARSADPLQQFALASALETSSASEQVNDEDNNGNHEQEMNQTAADVADKAKKPKNDEDDYYGPEHICFSVKFV
jgi:hypothetical protein